MKSPSSLLAPAAAIVVITLLLGCKKEPAPSCVKLQACCSAVAKDAKTPKTVVDSCTTFLGVMPRDPATGEVPGDAFCSSLAGDVRKDLGPAAPASCH